MRPSIAHHLLRYRPEVTLPYVIIYASGFLGTPLRQAQGGELCRTVASHPLD